MKLNKIQLHGVSPSEATSRSITHEYPNIFWNPKVHYHVRVQVFKAVVMKLPLFWYVTMCTSLKGNQCFGEHDSSLSSACWFLAWLFFNP
jgi:hypothetical protein